MNAWLTAYGAGGGCQDGVQVTGTPWTGIAAVTNAMSLLQSMAFAAAGIAGQGGSGKKQEDEGGGGCDVFIGVVRDAPSGGYGAGTVQKVVFSSDGTWSASGDTVNVIFPRI